MTATTLEAAKRTVRRRPNGFPEDELADMTGANHKSRLHVNSITDTAL